MYVLTAENMRKAEDLAVKNGSDFYTLMETACTRCADIIAKEDKGKKITILCGKGKNGGDGFVIARKLWQCGFRKIFVILVYGKPTDELCSQMYDAMIRYPVVTADFTTEADTCIHHIKTADVIVDSVFGIGFKGNLSDNAETAVRFSNENKSAKKYAVDIPSGLTADGEYTENLYFNADKTLTMIALKPVQVLKPTADFCGETLVMDIGVSDEILSLFAEEYATLTKEEALSNIRKRAFDSNKGDFGKILTICGSRNMTGCVYLCNQAAVEIGAGLITAAFPECIYDTVTAKLIEPLMLPLPSNENGRIMTDARTLYEKLEKSDIVAIGCGIGADNDTKELVKFIIRNCTSTLILDADALNCIAKDTEILKEAQCDIIITPHPGEMSRLTGMSIGELQNNRTETAMNFAKEYGVTVLLKCANTVIADKNGRLFINTTGNPSMARGGSGDVLTGLIAGLVPQTEDLFTAVSTACYIHGATADYVTEKFGSLSATPTRVVENLHNAMK